MNKKNLQILWVMGIGLTANAFADSSPRMYFAGTGSYYQEFYYGNTNEEKDWPSAQADCKTRGGHLVTITSKAENDFINTQSYQYDNYFYIGGSDAVIEGQWKWVTGEPWNFTAWGSNEPDSYSSYDYIRLEASNNVGGGLWYARTSTSNYPYMCEWESDYVQDSAEIGDLTGDGIAEIGVYKLVKGVRTVNLINPVTGISAGKLTFNSTNSIENSFIAPVFDMNGNGKPEVALVVKNSGNGSNTVYIKDVSNNIVTLKTFTAAGSTVDVMSMASVPDINNDGVSELQFLTKSVANGAGQIIIINPNTGAKLKTITP